MTFHPLTTLLLKITEITWSDICLVLKENGNSTLYGQSIKAQIGTWHGRRLKSTGKYKLWGEIYLHFSCPFHASSLNFSIMLTIILLMKNHAVHVAPSLIPIQKMKKKLLHCKWWLNRLSTHLYFCKNFYVYIWSQNKDTQQNTLTRLVASFLHMYSNCIGAVQYSKYIAVQLGWYTVM